MAGTISMPAGKANGPLRLIGEENAMHRLFDFLQALFVFRHGVANGRDTPMAPSRLPTHVRICTDRLMPAHATLPVQPARVGIMASGRVFGMISGDAKIGLNDRLVLTQRSGIALGADFAIFDDVSVVRQA